MKNLKKYLKWATLPIFLFGMLLIPNNTVKAATSDSFYVTWMDNIYFTKFKDGVQRSERARLLRRTSDGQFVYCIQPGVNLIEGHLMPGYDSNQDAWTGMTQEDWTRIKRIAYYGYGYEGRTDDKWYAITQYLIWKTHSLGWDTYFTDSFKGNIIYPFQQEINELIADVDAHRVVPSFSGITYDINVGETLELVDSNNVLSKYEIIDTGGVEVTKEGNKLYVKSIDKKEINIKFSKKAKNLTTPPIVYVDDISQNTMSKGAFDPVTAMIKVNIQGGTISAEKIDKDTGVNQPQGESASLKGAVYGIYNTSDVRIGSITTDENGKATSNKILSIGKYYLLEEKASEGYLVDLSTKYYFEITSDNINPVIKVYEKIINRNFEFTKVYASDKTGIMTPEQNIEFGFYNSKNELVAKETTDENGRIKVNLVYGTYTVKQLTTILNHEKVDDFTIEVNSIGETIYKVIANADLKAKLKLIKIDADSKKQLKLSGIKFKIFNMDKNEYVCQAITYPTAQNVCEFETDKNGEFITPYSLSSGNYRIEEIDQLIDGYLWNSIPFEFEIGENSKLVDDKDYGLMFEVEFSNKQTLGKIEVKKIGEKLIIENGTYSYEDYQLKEAEFNLYANKDIITKDGVTHFKKNELIGTIVTDENGIASFDKLPLGSYYIVETKTDSNLVISKEKYYFELTYKDQYTEFVTSKIKVKNYYKKGTLDFTKIDVSTSEPLPNTLIEIYTTNDELIYSGRTDENGKITITDLFIGDFYILEKETPNENYKLNPEPMYFSIKEDGEIIKATMTNELIIEVPDTDATDIKIDIVIATLSLIAGIGVICYAKKKKKKSQSK